MNKSTIKTAFVTALVLVVGVICIFSFHNSFTDRLNPFISQEISYAKVNKGTQRDRKIVCVRMNISLILFP